MTEEEKLAEELGARYQSLKGKRMTQKQNMYELWKAKELPEPYQKSIDSRLQFCKSEEERLFAAGFFVSNKIKEIRKVMGVEE